MLTSMQKREAGKGVYSVAEIIQNGKRLPSITFSADNLAVNCGFGQQLNREPARDWSRCMIKVQQRPTHLLLAAVDLPFLLIGQSEHGLPVLIGQVQLILQQQATVFNFAQTWVR